MEQILLTHKVIVVASEAADDSVKTLAERLKLEWVSDDLSLQEVNQIHQPQLILLAKDNYNQPVDASLPPVVLLCSACDNQQLVDYYQLGVKEVVFTPVIEPLLMRAIGQQIELAQYHLVSNECQLHKTKLLELGELVGLVSHEIASPLGNINTAVSFLLESSGVVQDSYKSKRLAASELERFLLRMNRALTMSVKNGSNASGIISSFRSVATNQCFEKLNQFYLHRYIDDVILSLKSKLKKLSHEIHVVIGESVEMVSYSGVIAQVMMALIDKSINHGFDDKVPGKIIISAIVKANDEGQERVMLNYMDDGSGIPEQTYEQLFSEPNERFAERDTLSMTMIKYLVEQKLKGTMTVASVSGEGVSVTLDLPQKLA